VVALQNWSKEKALPGPAWVKTYRHGLAALARGYGGIFFRHTSDSSQWPDDSRHRPAI